MRSNVWLSKPYRESYRWLLESIPPLLARTTAFSCGTITQSERQTLAAIGDNQEHNEKLLTYLERSQENYPCLVDIVTEMGCEEVAERLREALSPLSPQSPQLLACASAAEPRPQPAYPVQHTLAHPSQPGLLQGSLPQLEAQSQSKPLPLPKRRRLPTLRCLAKLHRLPKPRRLPKQRRLPKPRHLPKPRRLLKQHRLPKPRHLRNPRHLPKPRRLAKPRCLPMSPILPDKPLEPEVKYQPYVYPLDTLANGGAVAEADSLQADACHFPLVFEASPSSSDTGIGSGVDEDVIKRRIKVFIWRGKCDDFDVNHIRHTLKKNFKLEIEKEYILVDSHEEEKHVQCSKVGKKQQGDAIATVKIVIGIDDLATESQRKEAVARVRESLRWCGIKGLDVRCIDDGSIVIYALIPISDLIHLYQVATYYPGLLAGIGILEISTLGRTTTISFRTSPAGPVEEPIHPSLAAFIDDMLPGQAHVITSEPNMHNAVRSLVSNLPVVGDGEVLPKVIKWLENHRNDVFNTPSLFGMDPEGDQPSSGMSSISMTSPSISGKVGDCTTCLPKDGPCAIASVDYDRATRKSACQPGQAQHNTRSKALNRTRNTKKCLAGDTPALGATARGSRGKKAEGALHEKARSPSDTKLSKKSQRTPAGASKEGSISPTNAVPSPGAESMPDNAPVIHVDIATNGGALSDRLNSPASARKPQSQQTNEDESESVMECYAATESFGVETANHQGTTTDRRQPVQCSAKVARSFTIILKPMRIHNSGLYAGSSGSSSCAPPAKRRSKRPVVSIRRGVTTTATVSRRSGGDSHNLKTNEDESESAKECYAATESLGAETANHQGTTADRRPPVQCSAKVARSFTIILKPMRIHKSGSSESSSGAPPAKRRRKRPVYPTVKQTNEDESESVMGCYAATESFGAETANHQGTTTDRWQPVQCSAKVARSFTIILKPIRIHNSGLYAGSSESSSCAPPAKRRSKHPVVSIIEDGITTTATVSRRSGGDSHNLKVIATIVKSVQAHCEAEPFVQPVSLKDVPDYLEFVQEPMDFGTIRSRLTYMHYHYVETVLKDVHLVFHNCYIYNHESTDTYKSGLELERYFLKLLKTQLKDYFPCYTIALV